MKPPSSGSGHRKMGEDILGMGGSRWSAWLKVRMPESSEPAGATGRVIVFMRLLFFLGLFSLKNSKDEMGSLHNISRETRVSGEPRMWKTRIPRTTWGVRDTYVMDGGLIGSAHSPIKHLRWLGRRRLTADEEPPGVRLV